MSAYTAVWTGDSGSVEHGSPSILAAVEWAAKMPHISGPNGPVASTAIYRADGSRVTSLADELRSAGYEPLYVETGVCQRLRLVGGRLSDYVPGEILVSNEQ